MLSFEKKISKSEVLKVISQKGNNVGDIDYQNHTDEWGLHNLNTSQYLSQQECSEIHDKLKELNNA